ncbi:MAG: zinc dependent phospholipase C family protein, partial [Bacteroidia bacterium]
MRKALILFGLIFFVQALNPPTLYSWGFFGHKRINRVAVFTLPRGMFKFYKTYIDYLTEHAVDPDKRRYASKDEAPRHYIDIDHYGDKPFEIVPTYWDSAVTLLSEDTLQAYGIVPWHVNRVYYWLVKAFEEKDRDKILRLSAEIGHYIADAHVPLHTTENYNGQLTNQKGIHGFWESRLPELYADEYNYFVPKAKLLRNPQIRIWNAVKQSHLALDSVLSFEKQLTQQFDDGAKYEYDERGVTMVKTYSRAFSRAYHNKLDGMVERRMRKAIQCIGSFWYSAWIEAGQPKLDELINPNATKEYLRLINEEKRTWKRGNW